MSIKKILICCLLFFSSKILISQDLHVDSCFVEIKDTILTINYPAKIKIIPETGEEIIYEYKLFTEKVDIYSVYIINEQQCNLVHKITQLNSPLIKSKKFSTKIVKVSYCLNNNTIYMLDLKYDKIVNINHLNIKIINLNDSLYFKSPYKFGSYEYSEYVNKYLLIDQYKMMEDFRYTFFKDIDMIIEGNIIKLCCYTIHKEMFVYESDLININWEKTEDRKLTDEEVEKLGFYD